MKNIKGIAVATDGSLKRMAITYDVIDEATGKVTASNVKTNRVVTGEDVLAELEKIEQFAQTIIDGE